MRTWEYIRLKISRSPAEEPPEVRMRSDIRNELQQLLQYRDHLQRKFDLETDEDRIEVFIYEMEALDARIRGCLRRARVLRTPVEEKSTLPVTV